MTGISVLLKQMLTGADKPTLKTHISQRGIDLIKEFEGLRLEAYLDPVGIPTIGYGHIQNVTMGQKITLDQAEDLLRVDLRGFEERLAQMVHVGLHQYEWDALVSISYNIGTGALGRSTLMRLLNQEKYEEAALEFVKWNKAKGRVLPGLVRRRASEAKLFRGG